VSDIGHVLRYWRLRPGRYLRTGGEAWRLSVLLGCGAREADR
jgi:hypothetical protein